METLAAPTPPLRLLNIPSAYLFGTFLISFIHSVAEVFTRRRLRRPSFGNSDVATLRIVVKANGKFVERAHIAHLKRQPLFFLFHSPHFSDYFLGFASTGTATAASTEHTSNEHPKISFH